MYEKITLIANLVVIISAIIGITGGLLYYFRKNYITLDESNILRKAKSLGGHVRLIITEQYPSGRIKIGEKDSEYLNLEKKAKNNSDLKILKSLEWKGFITLFSANYHTNRIHSLIIEPYHWVLTDKNGSLLSFIYNKLRNKN